MKLQYEGQEVECITEGYWPEGVELICSDDGHVFNPFENSVCLRTREDGYGVALSKNGFTSCVWKYWAIKPTKPAPRRLTNREVAMLCRGGWDVCFNGLIGSKFWYKKNQDDSDIELGVELRTPDSDEWLEPTTALLEVGK